MANKGICFKWGDGHLKLSLTPNVCPYSHTRTHPQHVHNTYNKEQAGIFYLTYLIISILFYFQTLIWDQICPEGYPKGSPAYWQKKQGRRGGGGELTSFPGLACEPEPGPLSKKRDRRRGGVPLPFSSILYWPSVCSIYLCLKPCKWLKHKRKPPGLFQRIPDIKHCSHRPSCRPYAPMMKLFSCDTRC